MLIKRDKNEMLEEILVKKEIDEQAKNLLQGILYKTENAYKDYKKVKVKKQTEEKYIKELLANIDKYCSKISVVKPSKKVADEEIQKELEKNKYYVGEEIVSYPIEEKILYAIEKKSRHAKILNNKYEEATIAVSNLINEGKNLDRIEVLRDFNGWSWTTIKNEIGNIEANLIYQGLQLIFGEEFLDNWVQDKDGIIDHLELFEQVTNQKFKELLIKIAMANTAKKNLDFAQEISNKIQEINNYDNTEEKIKEITNSKRVLLKELKEIEKIIGQELILKAEFEKRNEEAPINQKIFNIKIFRKKLEDRKQEILKEIDEKNNLLNPANYLEEKAKLQKKKQELQVAQANQEQLEKWLIEFVEKFLKYFKALINKTRNEEKVFELFYKFRYFVLLPFNSEKSVKDVKELSESIIKTEKLLIQKARQKKIMADVPFEIMKHVFETRIIKLEDLYYKITAKDDKNYVQIFDENISEEKFEIILEEKTKINKKIKIFI